MIERDLAAAPEFHVPVLVDKGGAPGGVDRKPAVEQRQGNQCRARQRRDHVHGAEPPKLLRIRRFARDRGARGGKRRGGLRGKGNRFVTPKGGAPRLAAPTR